MEQLTKLAQKCKLLIMKQLWKRNHLGNDIKKKKCLHTVCEAAT